MKIIEVRRTPQLEASEKSEVEPAKTIGPIAVGNMIDCGSFCPTGKRALFHGTPVNPDALGLWLLPRQAQTNVNGKLIDHGLQAAISTSSDLVFPVIRSLMHDAHPVLAGQDIFPILSRRTNRLSVPYVFVAAEAILRHVDGMGGFVYGINNLPDSAEPFEGREDLAEWRIPEKTQWDFVGQTSVYDLPQSLFVVNAAPEKAQELLATFADTESDPITFNETAFHTFADWSQRNL